MKENLPISLNEALKYLKMCETIYKFVGITFENHKDLKDELSMMLQKLANEMSDMHVQLEGTIEVIRNHQDVYGNFGIEKTVEIEFEEDNDDSEN